jgi:hypothetical protein
MHTHTLLDIYVTWKCKISECFFFSTSIYIYPPIWLSVRPSVHPSSHQSVRSSVCLSARQFSPSVRQSILTSVCLSVCLSFRTSIYLSIYLSDRPSVRPSVYLIHPSIHHSIYLSIYPCCSHLRHRASGKRFVSLQFLNLEKSVGLLGRGISPSQGRYLSRTTETQNKRKHLCLEWDSNS